MADVVEGTGDAPPAVEQESREFEAPTEAAPGDDVPVEAAAPEPAPEEDTAPTPPPAEDGGSSSSSSDDEKEKKSAIPTSTDELPPASEVPAKGERKWNQLLSKIHPVVKKHADTVANHPYVTATASNLRQRAGQAQERMQPIVNHPYVQKGTGAIRAGGVRTFETGKKVSTDKRVIRFLVASFGLVALGLIIRVLLQKYPELGGDLKMKYMNFSKKKEL